MSHLPGTNRVSRLSKHNNNKMASKVNYVSLHALYDIPLAQRTIGAPINLSKHGDFFTPASIQFQFYSVYRQQMQYPHLSYLLRLCKITSLNIFCSNIYRKLHAFSEKSTSRDSVLL